MCRPAHCPTCDKSSWIGCGLHIPQAMSQIAKEDWCTCAHANGAKSDYPPKAGTGVSSNANVSVSYDS